MPSTNHIAYTVIADYLSGKTIKVGFLTNTATSPYDKDRSLVSEIAADEAEGGGYSRQTVAGIAIMQDDVDDRAEVDGVDVAFGSIGPLTSDDGIIKGVFMYIDDAGGDASRKLIGAEDITSLPEADRTPNGGPVTLRFGSNGFLQLIPS